MSPSVVLQGYHSVHVPNTVATADSPIAELHVPLYHRHGCCATIRLFHSTLLYYFHRSKDVGLAEAEGAGDVVRVVDGEPQLLLVQIKIGYTVAPVHVTHACPVLLATYQFLLQLPVLPSIDSA